MTYGTLARVSLAGGAPREMLEAVKYADWSPDGSELAIVRRVDGRELLEFPVGTVIAEPSSVGGGFSFPRVSPDGERVAFFELVSAGGLTGSIAVIDLRTRERILSPPYLNVFGLAWNGDEVWFTAAHERNLYRDAIHAMAGDGSTRIVCRTPGNASLHDVSPDGRVLMAHTVDRGGISVLAPGDVAERDLSWLDAPNLADISRDGSTVLFTEAGVGGGPGASVYLRATTGSPAVRLGDGWAVALSPDGRWALSVKSTVVPSTHLDLLAVGPGQSARIEHAGFTYGRATWLPDGERVVVQAQEKADASRLYILDLDSRALEAITPKDAVVREWAVSPDGALVAVESGSGVDLYDVGGGEALGVPGVTGADGLVAWIEGGLLVTEDTSQASLKVFLVEPRSGRRELWKEIAPRDPAGIMSVVRLTVTPDGRAYGYTWHRAISDLYLVEGLR
jgi:Tol biopolymer transport system component